MFEEAHSVSPIQWVDYQYSRFVIPVVLSSFPKPSSSRRNWKFDRWKRSAERAEIMNFNES